MHGDRKRVLLQVTQDRDIGQPGHVLDGDIAIRINRENPVVNRPVDADEVSADDAVRQFAETIWSLRIGIGGDDLSHVRSVRCGFID